ncbi:MAG: dihydrodipicolinate synthase family protein, partial [Planctomycetaceae bacterium]
ARHPDRRWNHPANARLISHLEAGGISTLLYGGNAVLGHVGLEEYAELLEQLAQQVASSTLVIPSVGPGYGLMLEQARLLRGTAFPTAMLLPTRDPTTPAGIERSVEGFVAAFGRPAVLYLKAEETIDVAGVKRLKDAGLLAFVKYAVPRTDPTDDPFLAALCDAVGASFLVSGMGEQPAIPHLQAFHLAGFTAGCVCLAPRLSQALLRAIQAGDGPQVAALRQRLLPLETLRDSLSPVRVLHEAIGLAGVAQMGPITPPLSPLTEPQRQQVAAAAIDLLRFEESLVSPSSPRQVP